MAIVMGSCWTNFCSQKLKRRILATFEAEATLDILRPVFEEHIISRRADVVWPPRGSDMTSMDYYLWGAVKDKCYVDKPETIDALKDNIREAIDGIQLHTIDNVLKNWIDRVDYCMASQPRQPFEWSYFPLLTGRTALSNKKQKFQKIFSSFF